MVWPDRCCHEFCSLATSPGPVVHWSQLLWGSPSSTTPPDAQKPVASCSIQNSLCGLLWKVCEAAEDGCRRTARDETFTLPGWQHNFGLYLHPDAITLAERWVILTVWDQRVDWQCCLCPWHKVRCLSLGPQGRGHDQGKSWVMYPSSEQLSSSSTSQWIVLTCQETVRLMHLKQNSRNVLFFFPLSNHFT